MNLKTNLCAVFAACCLAAPGIAAELVSPFAGSELLGTFRTDFDRFQYLSIEGDSEQTYTVEGRLVSNMYLKPSEKSSYEVFRSYEKELKAAGFEILAAIGDNKNRVQQLGRKINRDDGNRIARRAYVNDDKPNFGTPIDYLVTFSEHYISARKTEAGVDYLVVVLIADRKDVYAVDVLESAAMEENTVALSLDALRTQIASEGRVALYGILFDTGSSVVRPDSENALQVIANYLQENPDQSFYVVGHTDDQGELASNIQLSEARAEATVKALLGKVPGAQTRLYAHGVGPLSPVATNEQPDGRQLNRRVELVSTID